MKFSDLSEEEILTLRFWRAQGVGPQRFWNVCRKYGSLKDIQHNIPLRTLEEVQEEAHLIHKFGAYFVFVKDFPHLLTLIPDCPPVLTLRGKQNLWHKNCWALVGSRNASHAGRTMANRLATQLGAAGQVVVSGLARGIDAAAHQGSVNTGSIGVLAGGIDTVYPLENAKLYEAMYEEGLVVSEMPFGTKPSPQLFPRRNRLIAGLSKAVIVVEAAKPSGSLITADYALQYGRDVMAVPGCPLDSRSHGANSLIKDGAILLESAHDCLNAFKEKNDFTHTVENTYESHPEASSEESITRILCDISNIPV